MRKTSTFIKFIIFVWIIIGMFVLVNNNDSYILENEISDKTYEEDYYEIDYTPKMWEIRNEKNGNKIYLFGSIHVGCEEMYPLPDYVEDAFRSSKVLCVESDVNDVDLEASTEALTKMTYADGSTLIDHYTKEEIKKLEEAMGEYSLLVREDSTLKPIFYMMMLAELYIEGTGFSAEYGVDQYFLDYAYENNMKIKEIEDAVETMELLGKLSEDTQDKILKSIIKSNSELSKIVYEYKVNQLVEDWMTGNITEEEEDEDLGDYNEVLLDVRNVNMVNKVIEYLNTNEIHFYVVGAAHYEGEKGIINLLKEKGYKVNQVDSWSTN